MISIIIPLYNKEDYIKETVLSVLNQTFNDFELLLVDDGSTDKSLEVVNSIEDSRIRVISVSNSGVAVARNTGIFEAKFDFISFLDADDYWDQRYLQEIVELIAAHPDNSIFATGRSRIFGSKVERYANEYLPTEGKIAKLNYFKIISKYHPPLHSSDAVIKKTLLNIAGLYKPNQRNHEDHDLWLRVCLNEEIVFKNTNLCFVRKMVPNSASTNYYHPNDFLKYLDTIYLVKSQINIGNIAFFEKYYNKFILLTYIKHYAQYSAAENENVIAKIKTIVSLPLFAGVTMLNAVRSRMVFKFLKKIKVLFKI